MEYPGDMNEVQDAALSAITAARDEIQNLFSEIQKLDSVVVSTLMRLFSYSSERSQAVSFLISAGYVWDAEIILRSFYEANAKIWYISFTEDEKSRIALVEEFWGQYAAMHNHKRANRAGASATLFKNLDRPIDEAIFYFLMKEEIFDFGEGNKATRKSLEQKWSFTEIIKYLANKKLDGFLFGDLEGLLHMYGQASHLLHADDCALDLMLDRRLRKPDELYALQCAHVCRMFSDQVSFWIMSALALGFYKDGRKYSLGEDLRRKNDLLIELSSPFIESFNRSQSDFYATS